MREKYDQERKEKEKEKEKEKNEKKKNDKRETKQILIAKKRDVKEAIVSHQPLYLLFCKEVPLLTTIYNEFFFAKLC